MSKEVKNQVYQFGEYENDVPLFPLFTVLAGTKQSGISQTEYPIPTVKAIQAFARAVAANEKLQLLPQSYIGLKTEYVDGTNEVHSWEAGEGSDVWSQFVQAFKNARSRS
ncbi:MAG TPA: hypothetical protein VLH19_00530 [Patescibacteria group bacterium]|nr:hypothetical protein [Patescibacteria group bacterium]